jgi:hypothetical protein
MTVHKKLMEARIKLQGMELRKSGENKFAGYKYFELGDFLPQTMTIFHSIGLASVVSFDAEFARLCIVDTEDNSTITITSPMADANLKGAHPIQNLGAVESYQRRYLWLAAMEIVEHDIIDASAGAESKPVREALPKPAREALPKPTLPEKPVEKVTAGTPGEWQITLRERKDGDWAQAIVDATDLALQLAKSEADVQNIFKVNRVHFNRLKNDTPTMYDEVLEKFKQVKSKFSQE